MSVADSAERITAVTVQMSVDGVSKRFGGLLALDHGPANLQADHENAKFLARGLAAISGLRVDEPKVVTNIVVIETAGSGLTAPDLVSRFAERGLLANAIMPDTVRLVTHRDVNRGDCERAVRIIGEVLASGPSN